MSVEGLFADPSVGNGLIHNGRPDWGVWSDRGILFRCNGMTLMGSGNNGAWRDFANRFLRFACLRQEQLGQQVALADSHGQERRHRASERRLQLRRRRPSPNGDRQRGEGMIERSGQTSCLCCRDTLLSRRAVLATSSLGGWNTPSLSWGWIKCGDLQIGEKRGANTTLAL